MGQAEQDRIVRAYMQASSRITDSVVAAVTARWREMGAWRDINAEQFLSRVLPLIAGGMSQTAAVADAYLSLMLTDQLGRDVPPKGVDAKTLRDIRGVPVSEVYTRPVKTTRAAIGEGLTLGQAAKRGLDRLIDLTTTDLQMAARRTAHGVLSSTRGVAGYRRVLTGAENCGLCAVASTQRYHRGDLMPIHPGCDCKIAPIVGSQDPGHIIDEQRLECLHDAVAQRFGDDAVNRGARDSRDMIVLETHGELGPVLTVKGHRFTGPH